MKPYSGSVKLRMTTSYSYKLVGNGSESMNALREYKVNRISQLCLKTSRRNEPIIE